MTTLQIHRGHRLINTVLSLGIIVMTFSLILLFALAPASNPSYALESQQLKVLRYNQAD